MTTTNTHPGLGLFLTSVGIVGVGITLAGLTVATIVGEADHRAEAAERTLVADHTEWTQCGAVLVIVSGGEREDRRAAVACPMPQETATGIPPGWAFTRPQTR